MGLHQIWRLDNQSGRIDDPAAKEIWLLHQSPDNYSTQLSSLQMIKACWKYAACLSLPSSDQANLAQKAEISVLQCKARFFDTETMLKRATFINNWACSLFEKLEIGLQCDWQKLVTDKDCVYTSIFQKSLGPPCALLSKGFSLPTNLIRDGPSMP